MLEQMSDSGPDSAGVAVYRDPAPSGSSKLTLYSFDPEMAWGSLRAELAATFGGAHEAGVRANHAVFVVEGEAAIALEQATNARQHFPSLNIICLAPKPHNEEFINAAHQQKIMRVVTSGGGLERITPTALSK